MFVLPNAQRTRGPGPLILLPWRGAHSWLRGHIWTCFCRESNKCRDHTGFWGEIIKCALWIILNHDGHDKFHVWCCPTLNLKPSHLHYIHPQVCVKWRIFFVLATRWWTVVVTDLGGNFNRGNFVPRHVTSTTLTFRALLIPRSLWSSLSSFCLLNCELFNFLSGNWRNC